MRMVGMAVAPEVAVAEVVAEDDDDVRGRGGSRRDRRAQEGSDSGEPVHALDSVERRRDKSNRRRCIVLAAEISQQSLSGERTSGSSGGHGPPGTATRGRAIRQCPRWASGGKKDFEERTAIMSLRAKVVFATALCLGLSSLALPRAGGVHDARHQRDRLRPAQHRYRGVPGAEERRLVIHQLERYTVELVNGTGGGAAVYQTISLPDVDLAPAATSSSAPTPSIPPTATSTSRPTRT